MFDKNNFKIQAKSACGNLMFVAQSSSTHENMSFSFFVEFFKSAVIEKTIGEIRTSNSISFIEANLVFWLWIFFGNTTVQVHHFANE